MTPDAIKELIESKLPADVQFHDELAGDPFAMVAPEHWHEALEVARNEPDLFFDFLRAQTGTDYPDDEAIEVVVHLFSYKNRHSFVLKTRVDRKDPVLQTIEDIWPAANWYEREIFDLLGVKFQGHSDLRRLVLPEDWIGHPLRKDYKEQDSYNGIPTLRPGYARVEPGKKKKKPKTEPETKTEPEPKTEPKTEPETKTEPEQEPKPKASDDGEDQV